MLALVAKVNWNMLTCTRSLSGSHLFTTSKVLNVDLGLVVEGGLMGQVVATAMAAVAEPGKAVGSMGKVGVELGSVVLFTRMQIAVSRNNCMEFFIDQ